jgi:hypothetical protein
VVQPRQKFSDRQSADWILPVFSNFCQRGEHEGAFAKARVRHHQARFVDNAVAIEDQIEIKSTWRARIRALPAEGSFYVEQCLQEIACTQCGPADRGGVEEPGLGLDAGRLGVVECGDPKILNVGSKSGDCVAQDLVAVTLVAAKRDRNAMPAALNHSPPTTNHSPPTTN